MISFFDMMLMIIFKRIILWNRTVFDTNTTSAETINVPTQSVEKVQLHEQTIITIGSDYKTVWCPRTVHKTVG